VDIVGPGRNYSRRTLSFNLIAIDWIQQFTLQGGIKRQSFLAHCLPAATIGDARTGGEMVI